MARSVVSLRVLPPSMIRVTLVSPAFATIFSTSGTKPGAISTMTSSMPSAFSKMVSVCSMTALPAIFSSCLGIDRPTR
ncbi:hypothetical protein SGRI78S_06913 [Streptomyces griseus subsp. griseus]